MLRDFVYILSIRTFLRLKLPSCRSAEDLETRATSTTTKRRTFASHKQKSVQKSLLTFSQEPIRFPRLWDICTLMRVIRWNWGHPVLLTIASFLHSTRLKWGRFLPCPLVLLAPIYTQANYADTVTFCNEVLDHILIVFVLTFSFDSLSPLNLNVKSNMQNELLPF